MKINMYHIKQTPFDKSLNRKQISLHIYRGERKKSKTFQVSTPMQIDTSLHELKEETAGSKYIS